MPDDSFSKTLKQVKDKTEVSPAIKRADPSKYDCNPNCPECGGFGLVRYDVPPGHELSGKLFPCSKLPLDSPSLNYTGLDPYERKYDWSRVIVDNDKPELFEAIQGIIKTIERGFGLVYLWGEYGLGKSLLLKIAIATSLQQNRSKPVHYTNMPTIIDHMRMAFDDEKPGDALAKVEKHYADFRVLAIDEVGVERETQFGAEKGFLLIDQRYVAAIERQEPIVTLIASNLSPEELPGRTRSRIYDNRCLIFELQGDDFRLGADWE